MDVRDYYETYWSDAGYFPRGGTARHLSYLFESYLRQGMTCLDVGCGDGRTAGLWLREHGCQYTGVDISRNAVQEAQALGLDTRAIDDLSALPFPAESFDAAVCIEVLEHLFQPQVAAAEILRVLKPGGVLLATVPNVAYWRRRLDLALLGRWNPIGDDLSVQQPWRDPHIRFFNPGSLMRMLVSVGFHPVEVSGHDGSLTRDVPWIGKRLWRGKPSRLYRVLESAWPSLFGHRVGCAAFKPGASAI